MGQSFKISDELMELVRAEAKVRSRSLSAQATHWIKLGRAIEHSGIYDHRSINALLATKLDDGSGRKE